MIKKQFIWSCMMLLCGIHAAFAIVLPDGTDAIISLVEKYPSGKIKWVKLSEPTEFNTPIGKFTFNGEVTFYENGAIQFVGVTSYGNDYSIKIETPVGEFDVTALSFYEDGKLNGFYLGEELLSQTIQTNIGKLKVGGWVYLYESGIKLSQIQETE